jgi:RNA polymerase-binding protein DksA
MVTALSRADLDRLHAMLKERRAHVCNEVQERLHRHGLSTHDDAALPNRREDTDDEAAAESATRMDIAGVSRDAQELASLDLALGRVESGEYGECLECGETIALERLYANPAATRCAECQQIVERSARLARRAFY